MHRVQRVPVTESQGRIHTSAAGVLVLPEAEEVDVSVDPNDLRIDVFRSSGPGGQSVNTTDSAVRITHLPSGIVVSSQNEKSQLQNRESALRVLRSRLLAAAREEADAAASDQRRSQVRTMDRSERVRTYNFPENRIADHRVGYKAYNLDQVIDGDLDAVIDALIGGAHRRAAGGRLLNVRVAARRRRAPAGRGRRRVPAGGRRAAARLGARRLPRPAADPGRRCRTTSPSGSARWSTSGPTACRCSTSPAARRSGSSSSRSAPASSCPGRRPSSSPAGRWSGWPGPTRPIVVDLGVGSGAIALSLAHEYPGARVTAVERDPGAIEWTRHNAVARAEAGDTPVTVSTAT